VYAMLTDRNEQRRQQCDCTQSAGHRLALAGE
jgi:hypothetical protein